jgi:hypothetical protein
MNLKLNGIKVRVDKEKVNVDLEHSFYPFKDDESVEIICDYFKTGEKDKFAKLNENGEASFDFCGVFKKKVKRINGFTIDAGYGVEAIDTAEKLLALPAVPVLEAILRATAAHLLTSDGLTKDEEKNSGSDTNA